jgi:hypothetical protein
MTIYISERDNTGFFRSRHFIAYPHGGGVYTIVRSGILVLPNESSEAARQAGRPWGPTGFKGTGESNWRGERVAVALDLKPSISRLHPPVPAPSRHWAFDIDQWAPMASPNSTYNAGPSVNAGSAIDTFAIRQTAPADVVTLDLDVAVRDVDGYLYRVGFYVNLVGRLVQVDD